ncbi:MAG TPA: hypothetical protein DCY20_01425 [Firmicutes bacterium]|nr:hypothetical protein [Bacillota bacterium]
MEKVKGWVKNMMQRRSKMKAYGEKQVRYLLLVLSLLLLVGITIEYFYYATLGHLGEAIALEIVRDRFVKWFAVVGVVLVLDFILASIKGLRLKSIKDFFIQMSRRPALPFALMNILLLSFDIPISSLLLGSIVITLCCQNTKIGYSYYPIHPVIIGYFVGLISIIKNYSQFGIVDNPSVLNAPYLAVVSGPVVLNFEQFNLKYYSLQAVSLGLHESSLSFILILPMILIGLFLIRRRIIDFKVTLTYVSIYLILSLAYLQGATFEPWIFILQAFNGSMIAIAFFMLTDVVTLPSHTFYKYFYVAFVSLLTFICTYYIHFVYGPILAIGVSQILMFVTHLISSLFAPSLKVQFNKASS